MGRILGWSTLTTKEDVGETLVGNKEKLCFIHAELQQSFPEEMSDKLRQSGTP